MLVVFVRDILSSVRRSRRGRDATKTEGDKNGFTLELFETELAKKYQELRADHRSHLLVGPEKLVMPERYRAWMHRYLSFPVQPSDVWIVTFPKSGTTWTQEMVWLLEHNLDYEGAKTGQMIRSPFFEFDCLIAESELVEAEDKDGEPIENGHESSPPSSLSSSPTSPPSSPFAPGRQWKLVNGLTSPRVIKTHLNLNLLPRQIWTKKPRLIYVCRDPRDVCVSYYYHSVKLDGFTGTFEDMTEIFLGDTLTWAPYWKHILTFWNMRKEENVLFIRYEEMKKDLSAVIQKVAKFLGRQVTEEEVEKLADHLSFDSMKKNKAVNLEGSSIVHQSEKAQKINFIRKGVVGDWRNHFSEKHREHFKKWTQDNLEGTDFPYYQDYD